MREKMEWRLAAREVEKIIFAQDALNHV